jgi:septum formation protein
VRLVLASESPRRSELLARLGVEFEVVPSFVEERPPNSGEDSTDYALSLAREKAEEVTRRRPNQVVIGADTVVVLDGNVLGKPADAQAAVGMLESMAGREHTVTTGVCVLSGSNAHCAAESARVRMRPFTLAEVEAYVDSGEPMDKAGAYAVQGLGGNLVESVDGCRETVVGLPLQLVRALLERCGVIGA